MSISGYLFLPQTGKNLKPLKEKFRELGGFYNGIGYAFPLHQEDFLRQIVEHLPGVKIHKMTLESGQTFESFRQLHSTSYFREKLIKTEGELLSLQHSLALEDLSEESVIYLKLPEKQKDFAIALLQEREKLKEAISWTEGMEKALSRAESPKMSIHFISEKSPNFLLDEAPNMPRLVNFIEDGKQHPLIRKGIVGMLVGAGGVGKTHALAQLAISIATGNNWLGKFPIEKPGYVFMGLGENTNEDIHRLLRKIVKSLSAKKGMAHSSIEEFQKASKLLAVMSFTGADATFIHQGTPTSFYQTFIDELKKKNQKRDGLVSSLILSPVF